MGKTTVLPNSLDGRELQEIIDSYPDMEGILETIQGLANQLSPSEYKLALNKAGIFDSSSLMSFNEWHEQVIVPHHPALAEKYPIHDDWINVIEVV